jgi:hypothetical protein
MDFADYAFAKGFVEVAPTVIIQLYLGFPRDRGGISYKG